MLGGMQNRRWCDVQPRGERRGGYAARPAGTNRAGSPGTVLGGYAAAPTLRPASRMRAISALIFREIAASSCERPPSLSSACDRMGGPKATEIRAGRIQRAWGG